MAAAVEGSLMPYPTPSAADIESFNENGFLVVEDAVDLADLEEVRTRCQHVLQHKEEFAFDWTWESGRAKEDREFNNLLAGCVAMGPEFDDAPFRLWAVGFASALMGRPFEFWYDAFIAKPPRTGTPTLWHQDEALWGRNLHDRGITCWVPFHEVAIDNGCMHFIKAGHRDGVLEHSEPPGLQSGMVTCHPDESRTVPCPLSRGGVTFHHGRTPHMTPANTTDEWRQVYTQHLKAVGAPGEGDHYPWKVLIDEAGRRKAPSM